VGHVEHTGKIRNAYNISVGKAEYNNILKYHNKMKWEGMDWMIWLRIGGVIM
jgi:hypothetical protein